MFRMFGWYYSVFLLLMQVVVTTFSTSWPSGLYGLLKPQTGCPAGWDDRGFLFQDTEDTNPSNKRSEVLNIEGIVLPSNVLRYFCVKTTNANGSKNWAKGQYCIYSGSTVAGMEWGIIIMLDENTDNKDAVKFTSNIITKGNRYVNLYFYCSTKGNKKTPIELPITKPFYLLPYGSSECQQVKWMVATTEWIKYHTRDYQGYHYKYGKVPHYELGDSKNKGITMYYCYYKSCNYTLTDKKGVFQSPGFPRKYPDGQLCSWRIMVPANHTIHVHFTNFSLDENNGNDNLQISNHVNGRFQLNTTFHGNKQPFTITATSNVLFEFLTNEKHSSSGFRADYIIFKTSETTAAPLPTATNPCHITAIKKIVTEYVDVTTIPTKSKTKANNETTPAPSPTTGNPTSITTIKNIVKEDVDVTTITTTTQTKAKNGSSNAIEKPRVSECDRTGTIIAIVMLLICLIVVVVVGMVIFYRWRSKDRTCEKCDARFNNEDAVNETYDRGHIPLSQQTSKLTFNTTLGEDVDDSQTYQALSRDQPQYEAPDYHSKQNGLADPNMNLENPEYHELEPMDNNVPEVVYNVLEGPDPNNGPFDEQTYQALEKRTQNPLYQPANPVTMVTQNPLYGSLA